MSSNYEVVETLLAGGQCRCHRDCDHHDHPDDRFAVHHAAADHVEEPVGRDEGKPDVQAAAHSAVPVASRLRLLGLHLPARRDVLLARLELLDHGTAVPGDPKHADTGQRSGTSARVTHGEKGSASWILHHRR